MKIQLKNIGKIEETEISLEGITVIAGENNSGKSTVGRAFYAFFNGLFAIDEKIVDYRYEAIIKRLSYSAYAKNNGTYSIIREAREKISSLLNKLSGKEITPEIALSSMDALLNEFFSSFKEEVDNDEIARTKKQIAAILRISYEEVKKNILLSSFSSEFSGQINRISEENTLLDADVTLSIKNEKQYAKFSANEITEISHTLDLQKQMVYIDSPFILDSLNFKERPFYYNEKRGTNTHQKELVSLLYRLLRAPKTNPLEEISLKHRIEEIDFSDYGSLNFKERQFYYNEKREKNQIPPNIELTNTSLGIKTFLILKTLLQKGGLQDNGAVILDEPEVHLHPEWQLKLAKIIVQLQKEFHLHILITTHSPYFLRAIELYSKKYAVPSHFYLAENKENLAVFTDVSNDIEMIYKKFAYPFGELEDLAYESI